MIKSMKCIKYLIIKINIVDASNLNEYELTLRKLKPTLTEKDYFSKHEMIGKGRSLRIKETKWKTIFNSDLACLRYCCEVVKELEKNPGSKWEDPEFGATKTDEFGSHSMYIADNDIPSGCPQPKEVQWKRPE